MYLVTCCKSPAFAVTITIVPAVKPNVLNTQLSSVLSDNIPPLSAVQVVAAPRPSAKNWILTISPSTTCYASSSSCCNIFLSVKPINSSGLIIPLPKQYLAI